VEALEPSPEDRARLDSLRRWTQAVAEALAPRFADRAAHGFERECHGDLHLGNVAQLDGRPLLFDCIEFSERLRRIDVMSDVAFAAMDLARYGLWRHAARFVNRYVERTGDYAGLAVLRFYEVYRAMVRAKVAWIRACQGRAGTAGTQAAHGEFAAYLTLARRLSQRVAPALVLMHGLSASGKTTASDLLVEALGAVRVRSDVERKRLHGLDALASAAAAPGAGIYGERDAQDTYGRLAALAREVLAAGYPVVVDAAFLRRADRDRFRALAAGLGAGFQIAACTAPEAVLRARVIVRQRSGADASDAGIEVLESQLRGVEPLGGDEWVHAVRLDTAAGPAWRATVESLARRFGAHGS
jgi:predicted kinase